MDKEINEMFDTMLDETAKACAEEKVTKEEEAKAKADAKGTMTNMLKYLKSIRFNTQCKEKAKEYGVDKEIVKNSFIKGILGKLADVLHLTISITAEVVRYAVDFISMIINKILDFSYTVCINIVNLFTLNCGTIKMEG